jgi:hypothetical protein
LLWYQIVIRLFKGEKNDKGEVIVKPTEEETGLSYLITIGYAILVNIVIFIYKRLAVYTV